DDDARRSLAQWNVPVVLPRPNQFPHERLLPIFIIGACPAQINPLCAASPNCIYGACGKMVRHRPCRRTSILRASLGQIRTNGLRAAPMYGYAPPMPSFFPTTARLGFRTWSPEDIDLALGLWGDAAVARFIHASGPPSRAEIEARLAREIA